MKRDMNLIRAMLLQIESSSDGIRNLVVEVEGHSSMEVNYHLRLLIDYGLIEGIVTETQGPPIIWIRRMTWDGHDFLEAIRPRDVWQRVQQRLDALGGAAFDIVKGVALDEAKKLVL